MPEPNAAQRRLIDATDGLYLVDAGAGTGKTFAVTRRYARLIEQPDVEPDDVLLVTFTNTAATEMRERVVSRSSYGIRELRDAPIGTFHSLARDLLVEHGFDAPSHLGLDDRLTDTTRVLEDELVLGAEFRRFYDRFVDDHPDYADFYRIVRNPEILWSLVAELAAKGVFPTADGWYRDGERHLDGDFAAFEVAFDEQNALAPDDDRQSALRRQLGRYGAEKCYRPDAPERHELRGDGKAVPEEVATLAFEEDRAALKRFVHDVYFEYLAYALSRNYLTFGMLQGFAFVLLCEDHALRESLAFEYVLVDEFQDTSEIQFKLALLLCGTDNLCVVGDWKQSIYGFQYAAVENLTSFEARLDRFVDELNADADRVAFEHPTVERIELTENYRSTQAILDFAEHGLVARATGRDEVDLAVADELVSLASNKTHEHTVIEAVRHEEEVEALLTKLQEIEGNDAYAVEDDDGELRAPTLGDVAVLTRTRDFGRELLQTAQRYDIPMAYEGGIELYRTDQAKLVLAWLRILESEHERGWAVVLERAGYTLAEIKRLLRSESYPEEMRVFRQELASLEAPGAVAERVLTRYGFEGTYADVVIETIQDAHDATTMTRGDLIRLFERGIEEGATREVTAPAGTDAVTVQTIHAAKGLEYPIVVLANMNRQKFPRYGGDAAAIEFEEPLGLRQRKVFDDTHGPAHVYDNWHADVLGSCLPTTYDEERRLLYVAMTRAEHHLVFTAGETPNSFLEALPVEVETLEPDVREPGPAGTVQTALDVSVPLPAGPSGWTPHDLMRDDVFADVEAGEGTRYGRTVHDFAEAYALRRDVTPSNVDEEHVVELVDSLEGERFVEQEALLPLEVDGEPVAISGVVDLVVVSEERVTLLDYKTDRGRHAQEEYRKQLSVYYHVLDEWFEERPIEVLLFYTEAGERVAIEPLSIDELLEILRTKRGMSL